MNERLTEAPVMMMRDLLMLLYSASYWHLILLFYSIYSILHTLFQQHEVLNLFLQQCWFPTSKAALNDICL